MHASSRKPAAQNICFVKASAMPHIAAAMQALPDPIQSRVSCVWMAHVKAFYASEYGGPPSTKRFVYPVAQGLLHGL